MTVTYEELEKKIGTELWETCKWYQQKGVQFCVEKNGKIILSMGPRLGKTLTSLLCAVYHACFPWLIVAPASISGPDGEWFKQIRHYLNPPKGIVQVYKNKKTPLTGQIIIASYEQVVNAQDTFKAYGFRTTIIDEAHLLKNEKSKRTKCMIPIVHAADIRLLLTGTALNTTSHLYPLLHMVSPEKYPTWKRFANMFCGPVPVKIPTRYGPKIVCKYMGRSNIWVLKKQLREVMFNFHSEECLPPMKRHKLYVKADDKYTEKFKQQHAELEELLKKSKIEREEERKKLERMDPGKYNIDTLPEYENDMENLKKNAEFLDLVRKNSKIKIPYNIEVLKHMLKTHPDDTGILIFARHRAVLNALEKYMRENGISFIRIDGKVPKKLRQGLVDKFQREKTIRVALLSTKAANTGLTLSRATVVLICELEFLITDLLQAEKRAQQIGNKELVNVYYVMLEQSIEDKVWGIIMNKGINIDLILGWTSCSSSSSVTNAEEPYIRSTDNKVSIIGASFKFEEKHLEFNDGDETRQIQSKNKNKQNNKRKKDDDDIDDYDNDSDDTMESDCDSDSSYTPNKKQKI
jgi:SWI/SNF-related matrix-associated actin-dependent regulator 1 of chromatin subfamily A